MPKEHARILIVDDDPDVLTAARVVLRQKFEIVETENVPQRLQNLIQKNRYDVILLDMNFSAGRTSGNEGLFWLKEILTLHPQQQIVMITAYGDIKVAVEAMKIGAADFIVKPWENEKLEATVLTSYHVAIARKEIRDLRKKQSQFTRMMNSPETDLVGNSVEMKSILNSVHKVAETEANVLLLGENGTGKELIAKYIHQESNRKEQPFVKVDAGSLSANLFESELFGHKRGAFTDAREDRIGRLELANGGTLFLDEVGNLPLSLQVKLLSVLQNREVIPIGSNQAVPIDVRLICATNLNIHQAVDQGEFRQDLLFRINTVEITVPPLRARPEDVPVLANHFLKVYSTKYRKENKTISEEAIKYLMRYSWPGNVRELQHAIERAVIMGEHEELNKHDFLFSGKRESSDKKEPMSLDEMEKKAIIAAIQRYNGNMSKVAKELGVGRTTLYRKLTKYGLEK